MKKIIARFSAWLRKRMHQRVINAAPWYVGDPCYIIPDDQWEDFCNAYYAGEESLYGDDCKTFKWRGQEITLWTNGGDGSWSFNFYDDKKNVDGGTSFCVDAGFFGVIDLRGLPVKQSPMGQGMLFEREPDLYVDDGCVYLNGEHDNHHQTCDNFQCGRVVAPNEVLSCGNGCCEGCDHCGHGWECEEE